MNHTTYLATLLTARDDHQRHADALDRALIMAESGNIPTRVNGVWQMRSSDGKRVYHITADGCECTAGTHHRLCKHMAAMQIAEIVEAMEIVDDPAHVPAWSEKQAQDAPYADMGETPPDECMDCDSEPVYTTKNSKAWPDLAAMPDEAFLQFLKLVRTGN